MKIVLDTHIFLFAALETLDAQRTRILTQKDAELYLSVFSLWEISKLIECGRIDIPETPLVFLNKIALHPKYQIVSLTPEILDQTIQIAPKMHKDPADQVITATAIYLGAHLMTDDQKIIRSGVLKTEIL